MVADENEASAQVVCQRREIAGHLAQITHRGGGLPVAPQVNRHDVRVLSQQGSEVVPLGAVVAHLVNEHDMPPRAAVVADGQVATLDRHA